jgi:predicted house-cleaning NTP pyrophosphatase (Maf/HAM1 superfamily)
VVRLVLASDHQGVRCWLESAGIAPLVVPSNVDEDAPVDDMDPGELVKGLGDARSAKCGGMPDDYVLGGRYHRLHR